MLILTRCRYNVAIRNQQFSFVCSGLGRLDLDESLFLKVQNVFLYIFIDSIRQKNSLDTQ